MKTGFLFGILCLLGISAAVPTLMVEISSYGHPTPYVKAMYLYNTSYPFEDVPANTTGTYEFSVWWRNQSKFNINMDWPMGMLFYDSKDGGGYREEPLEAFRFPFPYFGSEERIRMSQNGRVIFDEWASKYLCNNNSICDTNEDYYGCPSDCPEPPAPLPVTTLADKLPQIQNLTSSGQIQNLTSPESGAGKGSLSDWLFHPLVILLVFIAILIGLALIIWLAYTFGRRSASGGPARKSSPKSSSRER